MQNITDIFIAESESSIRVFDHRNPDSDTIGSPLAITDWLNHTGKFTRSYRPGAPTSAARRIPGSALSTAPLTPKAMEEASHTARRASTLLYEVSGNNIIMSTQNPCLSLLSS